MGVTIKDIAQKAGVSYSTVSRALNGIGSTNGDRRKRILEIAKEMGYVPNQAAIHLKLSRSYVIGLYFSTISKMTSPFVLHDVLTGVYSIVGSKYNIVVKGIDMHEAGTLNPTYYDGIIVLSQLQIILPVPVHRSKLRKRGYNQAELLADVVGRRLDIPVDNGHLLRVSDTTPQKELSPLERANNIKQALEVRALPAEWKTVLLIDDIYTTGATVQACTEALQEAGVEQVYVGVICIGEGR